MAPVFQEEKQPDTDLTDLTRLSVARLLDLVRPLLGESNAEHADLVVVGGLHINVSLDQTLPLAHQRSQLVGGEVHALKSTKQPRISSPSKKQPQRISKRHTGYKHTSSVCS